MRQQERGCVVILIPVGLALLGMATGLISVLLTNADNQHTLRALTDETMREPVTDQQIKNLRNSLHDNAEILTGFASLGTAPLVEGESSLQVAGNVLVAIANDPVRPEVVKYMSDPASSWNRNGGAARPSEGTNPTGGTISNVPAGANTFTADVTIEGTDLSFNIVSTTGSVSSGVDVAAWDTAEATPGASTTTLVVITDPTAIGGPATYSLGSSTPAAGMVGFRSQRYLNNDGSPVGFDSPRGTLVVTGYARSPGGRFVASFNCTLSGEQWIDSKGTTRTLTGSASGSFDIELGP